MLGGSSSVDSLFVWFPASWMPLVVEALREKSFASTQVVRQMGVVAPTDQAKTELPEGLEFTYKVKRWQADARGCCPVLQSRINVDWLTFDPQMFVPLFPRLKEGILYDVFIQKAAAAWDNAPSNRIMVSLLLPGPMEMDQWLKDVRACINMWPLQKTEHVMTNHMVTEVFMRRERKRLQARHIWETQLNLSGPWSKIESGPNMLRVSRMMHSIDASSYVTTLKNPDGWRTPTRASTGAGSNSSGSIVGHGLRVKSQWVSTLYLHGLCFVLAMDNSAWEPCRTGLAHTAGNLPTETSTGC